MQIIHLRKMVVLSIVQLGLLVSLNTANAAEEPAGGACCTGLIPAINNVETAVTKGFEQTITLINDLVKNVVDFSLGSNTALKTSYGWVDEDGSKKITTQAKQTFTNTPQQVRNIITTAYSKVPIPGDTNADNKIGNFTYSTLTGSMSLDDDKQKMAQEYLQFLSYQTNPIEPLDPQRINFDNPKPYLQLFQNSFGTYMATQSVALSTFYKIIADRTPQTGLGDAIGRGTNSKASPLELQEHIVKSHLDSKWMEDMIKANPADVQKQMLFVLVNIENLLFQNRMQLEQLNSTNAALLLQDQSGLNRQSINDYRVKAGQ